MRTAPPLAESRRAASKRSRFEERRAELEAFQSIDNSSDHQGLERYVTLLSGVCIAKRDVTVPRLVPNQMSREHVVGRGGGGKIAVFFREGTNVAQLVRAQ